MGYQCFIEGCPANHVSKHEVCTVPLKQIAMTPHVVPTGWTRGQALCQHHDGASVGPKARYRGQGAFPGRQQIALCQDFGAQPPPISDCNPDNVYAISFYTVEDIHQWLNWWYAPLSESDA